MGPTDGECSKRLWSRLRSLIATTRACSVSARVVGCQIVSDMLFDFQRARWIWFLDNKLLHIGSQTRKDLGARHIRKISKDIDVQSALTSEDIASCGIQAEVLREEWTAQRQAQCSVRSHTWVISYSLISLLTRPLTVDAPTVLKKNLAKLLDIQQNVDALSNTVNAVMSSLEINQGSGSQAQTALAQIVSYQSGLIATCEKLYASLNIPGDFENAQGISVEYLQTLLLARDLKVNICQ